MKVPFLDLSWQHKQIEEELKAGLEAIFAKTAFINGPDVALFEQNFASYLGVKHCIGVANGTDALILSHKALGIGAGDEVITIPTTFFATSSSTIHAGATPVFVDIDPVTRNFDFEKLEKAITSKTKAIIPVHLYGQPVDMVRILDISKRHNLKVIEDSCQSQGALFQDRKAGSFGDISSFSFYPGKNLGAYGDAGCVCTNDDETATTLRKLRDHGMPKKYVHEIVGYNSRLDTIQALVLRLKLEHLDKWNDLRIEAAKRYIEKLKDVSGITLYDTLKDTKAVFHLFIVRLREGLDRDDFMTFLSSHEIGNGIHYPFPLHETPAFSFLGYKTGDFKESEAFAKSIVSLPMYPGITTEQIDFVAEKVKEYVESHS